MQTSPILFPRKAKERGDICTQALDNLYTDMVFICNGIAIETIYACRSVHIAPLETVNAIVLFKRCKKVKSRWETTVQSLTQHSSKVLQLSKVMLRTVFFLLKSINMKERR